MGGMRQNAVRDRRAAHVSRPARKFGTRVQSHFAACGSQCAADKNPDTCARNLFAFSRNLWDSSGSFFTLSEPPFYWSRTIFTSSNSLFTSAGHCVAKSRAAGARAKGAATGTRYIMSRRACGATKVRCRVVIKLRCARCDKGHSRARACSISKSALVSYPRMSLLNRNRAGECQR